MLGSFIAPVRKSHGEDHIDVFIHLVERLPAYKKKRLLVTAKSMNEQRGKWCGFVMPGNKKDRKVSYQLYEGNGQIIFERWQLDALTQVARINNSGTRVEMFLDKDYFRKVKMIANGWDIEDFLTPFSYVLAMNYLIPRQGIILHSCGVLSENRKGILFIGLSGTGKSTLASFWRQRHGIGAVLNDDRVIVRRIRGQFKLYRTPWSGEFNEYTLKAREGIILGNSFFIKHGLCNSMSRMHLKDALAKALPNIFFPFWDHSAYGNVINFCKSLFCQVPPRSLSFKKSIRVVNFIDKNIEAGCQ
jgi:hypothetical protein